MRRAEPAGKRQDGGMLGAVHQPVLGRRRRAATLAALVRIAAALVAGSACASSEPPAAPEISGPFESELRVAAPIAAPGGSATQGGVGSTALESRPLGRDPGARAGPARAGGGKASPASQDWLVRTGGALGVVLLLIFGLRAVVRRVAARAGLAGQIGAGGRAPSGLLEIIGRYPVARGQTLALLRVDRRILLVCQSSSGLSTLAEMADPEEVASILVQARDAEGDSMAERFGGLLRSMERDPDLSGEEADADAQATSGARVIAGPEPLIGFGADPAQSLRRRLRALRSAGGRVS